MNVPFDIIDHNPFLDDDSSMIDELVDALVGGVELSDDSLRDDSEAGSNVTTIEDIDLLDLDDSSDFPDNDPATFNLEQNHFAGIHEALTATDEVHLEYQDNKRRALDIPSLTTFNELRHRLLPIQSSRELCLELARSGSLGRALEAAFPRGKLKEKAKTMADEVQARFYAEAARLMMRLLFMERNLQVLRLTSSSTFREYYGNILENGEELKQFSEDEIIRLQKFERGARIAKCILKEKAIVSRLLRIGSLLEDPSRLYTTGGKDGIKVQVRKHIVDHVLKKPRAHRDAFRYQIPCARPPSGVVPVKYNPANNCSNQPLDLAAMLAVVAQEPFNGVYDDSLYTRINHDKYHY